eukprot:TRINITY_DN32720_c0_g1_i1.p2 TRINITY_DN32720_c0_g1~~TRINITY_DN32720_c0_g1_i1.p2  ORF type:complete len:317 (+),score=61.04 TRINITY_DN32720_c0_g1_i1:69-1019(+)
MPAAHRPPGRRCGRRGVLRAACPLGLACAMCGAALLRRAPPLARGGGGSGRNAGLPGISAGGRSVGGAGDSGGGGSAGRGAASAAGGCADSNTLCGAWAAAGECGRNPGYMLGSCALSCGACAGAARAEHAAAPAGGRPLPDAASAGGAAGAGAVVTLNSSRGAVQLRLRGDISPKTAARLAAAAAEGQTCSGCRWYRNEAVPREPPPSCGEIGPCGPYSLVQGFLAPLVGTPAEGTPLVTRGMAARIQQGGDFFVSLGDHSSWGQSFTVFAEVVGEEGMRVLDAIADELPWHAVRSGVTEMRMLNTELPLTLAGG